MKSYSELLKIKDYNERYKYLRCDGKVGEETFADKRHLNQLLYKSSKWKEVRRKVVLRDNGYDLGHPDHEINGRIEVHHMNPITLEDVLLQRDCVFDPENLISTSSDTHKAIHYGREEILVNDFVERRKNDTCLWR